MKEKIRNGIIILLCIELIMVLCIGSAYIISIILGLEAKISPFEFFLIVQLVIPFGIGITGLLCFILSKVIE